jgi:hypothetical protein
VLADDSYGVIAGEVHRRMSLSDPGIDDYRNELLWSPERPTLIEADIKLLRGSEVLDEVQSYTALRSITVQREKSHIEWSPLHDASRARPGLLARHVHDSTVRTRAAGRRGPCEVDGLQWSPQASEAGGPALFVLGRRSGLVVWAEMPSAYRFTGRSIKRLMREWTEAIERDLSHPCVVIWVRFNESWGVPELSTTPAPRDAVAAFYHLTRTLDPSRLVVGNDGWGKLGHRHHRHPRLRLRSRAHARAI